MDHSHAKWTTYWGPVTEGLSKAEIMRCLKRYVARELFPLIRGITDQRLPEQGEASPDEIAA